MSEWQYRHRVLTIGIPDEHNNSHICSGCEEIGLPLSLITIQLHFLSVDFFQIIKLQRHIEEVASKEPYMGEQIPLSWLRFEQALLQLVEDDTCFSSITQVRYACLYYHM